MGWIFGHEIRLDLILAQIPVCCRHLPLQEIAFQEGQKAYQLLMSICCCSQIYISPVV